MSNAKAQLTLYTTCPRCNYDFDLFDIQPDLDPHEVETFEAVCPGCDHEFTVDITV
jgi:hypothetical protein